jgi:hypothetical protein
VTNSRNPESVALEANRQGRKLLMISLLLQWPSIYIYVYIGVFSAFSETKLDEAVRIRSVSNGICSCGKHGSGKWFNLVLQGNTTK